MKAMTIRSLLPAAALVALAAAGPASGASSAKYYLAVGDSIAYGLQPDKVDAGLPPSGFDTGYVDVVARRLRAGTPGLKVVNLGCPGETTVTYLHGGCPWAAAAGRLHDPYRGPQAAAAAAFLRAHGKDVDLITVTLWANDVNEIATACADDIACVTRKAPAALAALARRLGSIVQRLHGAAPNARVVVTGAWSNDIAMLAKTRTLYRELDQTIRKAAVTHGARFAEVLPVFNPPTGARAAVCRLTFVCSRHDGHPTDAGYRAIAASVAAALAARG